MILRRGYRYKLRPTEDQEQLLQAFAGHARFLWNKVVRLNQTRLSQGLPIIWYQEADYWSKQWKRSDEYGFLKELPAHCVQQKLRDLDKAYTDGFDRTQPNKRLPVLKKRGVGDSFRFPEPKQITLSGNRIKLPKLGWIRFFDSRPIEGAIKNVTVTRQADGWYISIQTERELNSAVHPAVSMVGIDRGVVNFAALSNGMLIRPLNSFGRYQKQLARLQRRLAKKVRFSANWKKLKQKISQLHHKIACCRQDFLHKLTTTLSKNHACIVLEALQIKNMTGSAKGTLEHPGQQVKQKRGLNRSILDQGWGLFATMLSYKLAERGGWLLEVPPAGTSQTCPVCKYRSPENRQMQAHFECQRCGLRGAADVIAGINIEAAGQALLGSVPSAEGAVTVCGETGLPASVKQKPVESRETAPLLT